MKQIILDHPRGQVLITISSNEEKLVTHVAKKIEDLFNVKTPNSVDDFLKGILDNLGKK